MELKCSLYQNAHLAEILSRKSIWVKNLKILCLKEKRGKSVALSR